MTTVTASSDTTRGSAASTTRSRNAPTLICGDCERPIPDDVAACFWWGTPEPSCEPCAAHESDESLDTTSYWLRWNCNVCGRPMRGERGRSTCCSDECAQRLPAIRRAERRRRLRAGIRNPLCFGCGEPITGTVCWHGKDARCEPCFAARRATEDRIVVEYWGKGSARCPDATSWPGEPGYEPFRNRPVEPCCICGRGVRDGQWTSGCCCDPCRVELENRNRRVQHEPRVCAADGCEVVFTPKRADALYHSAACRQRAYRQRVTAVRGPPSRSSSPAADSRNGAVAS